MKRVVTTIATVLMLVTPVSSQPALQVSGDLASPAALNLSDLEALGAVEVLWDDHGSSRTACGVSLEAVLERCGFSPGERSPDVPPSEKRDGWRRVVVCSAPDGFQAIFSAGEIHPLLGVTRAHLVWRLDGAPLPEDMGPFRLVVTTDREGSRCIYRLNRIDVVDMRRVIPPMTED